MSTDGPSSAAHSGSARHASNQSEPPPHPNIPESYVHRIGRTGRAGASGIALSFVDREERAFLKDIERTIRRTVPVVADHPFPPGTAAVATDDADARPARPQQRRGGGGNGGGGGGGRGPRRTGAGGGGRGGPSQGGQRPAQSASSGSSSQGQAPRAAPAPSGAPPARRQQRVYSKW